MTEDRFVKWLAIVSNVGILIGLILVAYELRQNDEALRQEVSANRTDAAEFGNSGFREIYALIISDPEVANVWLKGNQGFELTPVDAERYRLLAFAWIRQAQGTHNAWSRHGSADFLLPVFEREMKGRPGLIQALKNYHAVQPDDFSTDLLERVDSTGDP